MGLDARIGVYLLSTLVHVLKGITRHYRVEIDGEVIDGEQTMIFVGNGRWYGGGFLPVPEADPTDGELDVLLVKKIGRLTVAKFIGLYNEGRYREFPQYVRHYTAGRVKITCDQTGQVNLDGELRLVREVEFCHSLQAAVFLPGIGGAGAQYGARCSGRGVNPAGGLRLRWRQNHQMHSGCGTYYINKGLAQVGCSSIIHRYESLPLWVLQKMGSMSIVGVEAKPTVLDGAVSLR